MTLLHRLLVSVHFFGCAYTSHFLSCWSAGWPPLQDPLGQTVRQVHAAFGVLLDIVEVQAQLEAQQAQHGAQQAPQQGQEAAQQGEAADGFLLATARELLAMGGLAPPCCFC